MMDFFGYTSGTPVAITAPNKNPFYLISVGGLHPVELPTEIQSFQRTIADLEGYRVAAAIRWLDKNIDKDEEQASAWVKSVASSVWLQFLSPADRDTVAGLLGKIGDFNQNYELMIATAMMRQRLAWTVQVDMVSIDCANRVRVKTPWFEPVCNRPIVAGDRVRACGQMLSVKEVDGKWLELDRLPNGIEGSSLFLMNSDGSYQMGFPAWTEDDSRSLLTSNSSQGKSQLAQIADFYSSEGKEEQPEASPLVSDETSSETMPSQKPSAGNPFTIDSLTSDAAIPESSPTVTFSNAA